MCFGGGSKAAPAPAPPPPVVAMPNPTAVADNSNDMPRKSFVNSSTSTKPQSFGAELGAADQTKL